MAKLPPTWQVHRAINYDITMMIRCTVLLRQIILDPARRRDILADPRNLHRELFASFAPPGHDEYAGTYRGTRAPRSLTEGVPQKAWSSPQTSMNSASLTRSLRE
jgi:hypothetical protein